MKKTILKFRLYIYVLIIPYILIVFIGVYRIDYSILVPGVNDSVESFIEIVDPYESLGSFHTTSVINIEKPSIMMYLLSIKNPEATVSELPSYFDYISVRESTVMGYLMKDDSINSSLALSLDRLNYESVVNRYNLVYLTYSYLAEDTIEVGDYVLKANDSTDFRLEMNNTVCGESVAITVQKPSGDIITYDILKTEIDGGCYFGLYIKDFTDIVSTSVEYNIIENRTGGPSGGLMQALYIYNELTEKDYTHGLKIAGTGTINTFGEVGSIGAIRQKLLTAVTNNIDIFFVPHRSDSESDNYIQALEIYESLNTDMILVGVANFDEALAYLDSIEGDLSWNTLIILRILEVITK